jgi:hypothetical protein
MQACPGNQPHLHFSSMGDKWQIVSHVCLNFSCLVHQASISQLASLPMVPRTTHACSLSASLWICNQPKYRSHINITSYTSWAATSCCFQKHMHTHNIYRWCKRTGVHSSVSPSQPFSSSFSDIKTHTPAHTNTRKFKQTHTHAPLLSILSSKTTVINRNSLNKCHSPYQCSSTLATWSWLNTDHELYCGFQTRYIPARSVRVDVCICVCVCVCF